MIENTEEFEENYVHRFYSEKSDEFGITRQKHWPKTLEFLRKYNKKGFLILDNGCGNGRCILEDNTIGLDYSYELLKQAKRKPSFGLVKDTVIDLPFKNESFDLIMSVAVLHHLSTPERRNKMMEEMHRVLKDNGKILLYVWNYETKHKEKFIPINEKDFFVTWNKDKTIKRYYYLYNIEELRQVCQDNNFHVIESGIEQESIFVILKKITSLKQ